jgi:hypothetical protein
MLPDSATAALSDLHADFVQGWKSLQQNTGIELSLVYGRRLSVQTKQRVDHRLRGANGILNCEHHIVGEFAILSNEGEVLETFRYNLGAIALASRKKLAGDERHHARDADAGIENPGTMLSEAQMAYDLRHDFSPRA